MLAILQAMRDGIRTVGALRSALSGRRDLLLEYLALRHQVAVLSRSDRRFRTVDRLLWLCLRRLWPGWRQALVLVQPATVVRWGREGLRRCRSRRSGRRPGRPRIDSEVRALIRRMAAENRLWGAPRIHGELLKLGVAVSERTVSRYLADIPRAPSQTWRTFLANHFGQLACTSPVMLCDASDEDDGADFCGLPPRCVSAPGERSRICDQWSDVHWPLSFQRTPVDGRIGQAHVPHRRCEHPRSGRDPPKAQAFAFIRTHVGGSIRGASITLSVSVTFRGHCLARRWMPPAPVTLSPFDHVVRIDERAATSCAWSAAKGTREWG
jgi:hypothetical protein